MRFRDVSPAELEKARAAVVLFAVDRHRARQVTGVAVPEQMR